MEIAYPSFKVNSQEVGVKDAERLPNIKLHPLRYSTLIMYDPDAVYPPYLHFLVINIQNGNIQSGDVIVSYNGPTPPPGTGTHRYIFEQYEQKSPFVFPTPERPKFNLDLFKKQHNLALKATKMFRVTA